MKVLSQSIFWGVMIALFIVFGCRGKAAVDAAPADQEHGHEAEEASSVTLTDDALSAADIKTAAAETRALKRRIAAPGELEFNARRLAHITARTSGRVERVLAVAGDRVRGGQVLAEIYSPDYMAIQAEYLQAADRARRNSWDPAEARTAQAIWESARERLLLVGATPADVDGLGGSPVPRPLLPVRASFSGTVLESGVFPGDHVELGTSLFRLADLSTLWAGLRIQERDLAAVKPGVEVELRTQAYPGDVFHGRLLLIGDALDTKTRTVTARVEVPNPAGKLKSGMYVEASFFETGERAALVVPESSVQDNEGRPVVFVRTGERTFTRRQVKTGERLGGYIEVIDGIEPGEQVVLSGGFLLNSELHKGTLKDEHGHD